MSGWHQSPSQTSKLRKFRKLRRSHRQAKRKRTLPPALMRKRAADSIVYGGKSGFMSTKIFRPDTLPKSCVDSSDKLLTTLYLAMAGGGEKLYANIDRLQP